MTQALLLCIDGTPVDAAQLPSGLGAFASCVSQTLGCWNPMSRSKYRGRPSLLLGAIGAAGAALGAASALAPRPIAYAVAGGLQDALTDHFTEKLRLLREQEARGPLEVCAKMMLAPSAHFVKHCTRAAVLGCKQS